MMGHCASRRSGLARRPCGPQPQADSKILATDTSPMDMLNPEQLAQEQLDAYNARDLDRFMACYAEDIALYRPPAAEPVLKGKTAMAAHYAANRFDKPGLHAELLGRLVVGSKVFDHERVHGVREQAFEVVAAYEVRNGRIVSAFFFDAD